MFATQHERALTLKPTHTQDTATGLPHAEAVHDAVIGDLLDFVVVPAFHEQPAGGRGGAHEQGEWEMVRPPNPAFAPAAKTTGNTMRWRMHQRREAKQETGDAISLDPAEGC